MENSSPLIVGNIVYAQDKHTLLVIPKKFAVLYPKKDELFLVINVEIHYIELYGRGQIFFINPQSCSKLARLSNYKIHSNEKERWV